MQNILLTIQYDGTDYAGWQRQKNGLAVQQVIEDALSKITKERITITGSGRTDAGVHALGQAANFVSNCTVPLEKLPIAINSIIPDDIRVISATEVAQDFNARFSAKRKTYRYTITWGKNAPALYSRFSWHSYYPLDIEKMQAAARLFEGTHDFNAFMASGSPVSSTVRTIYSSYIEGANIEGCENALHYYVTGNGFLYNMVRIITGTLIEIGQGRREIESIGDLLNVSDERGVVRAKAGFTTPPNGLTLMNVDYTE